LAGREFSRSDWTAPSKSSRILGVHAHPGNAGPSGELQETAMTVSMTAFKRAILLFWALWWLLAFLTDALGGG
jgi:hypothetical protein